jgi:alkanesulfonate monooxygenase SsuD/methylene tetrahydromethanopterin reductase-like flavin-dependent oxidoreductase (luciferase family)
LVLAGHARRRLAVGGQQKRWTAGLHGAPAPANILYRNYAYVADTDAEAEQQSQEFGYGNPASAFLPRHRGFGEAYGEIFGASYTLRAPTAKPRFCGSPTTVIEQIREFQDAGFGRIDLTFTGSGLPYELGKCNLELFAHEVLPAVHEFSTAANAVV